MEEKFAFQSETRTNDACYCLLSSPELCKEHHQDMYILYIDLIKASDTANHDLLFAILVKYGAPPVLIDCCQAPSRGLQIQTSF
jgi:hypothetical protein